MARKPISFFGLSTPPVDDKNPLLSSFLNGVKQNMEILTGAKPGSGGKAVVQGHITVPQLKPGTANYVPEISGIDISGVTVASSQDLAEIATAVNQLVADNAELRRYINTLVKQLQDS